MLMRTEKVWGGTSNAIKNDLKKTPTLFSIVASLLFTQIPWGQTLSVSEMTLLVPVYRFQEKKQ